MATTLTPGTLRVKLTENLSLGNSAHNVTASYTKTGITHFSERYISVPTGGFTEIMKFDTKNSAGQYIEDEFKYMVVENMDNSNQVVLKLSHAASQQNLFLPLHRGQIQVIYQNKFNCNATNSEMSASTYDTTSLFSLTFSNTGSGYAHPPTASFTPHPGGTGSPATASFAINATGGISNYSFNFAGTGYTTAPTVTITGGGSPTTHATASATVKSDALWTPNNFYNFDTLSAMASGSTVDLRYFIAIAE